MPRFPYDPSRAPVATKTRDDGSFLRMVEDYVRQTRHWSESDYRIRSPQKGEECDCLYYEVEYLPDIRREPPGVYYTGGTANSFGLALDAHTGKVVKEFGLQ